MTARALLVKPSGFLPVAMSLAGLAIVIWHVATFGIVRQADEDAAVHVWQLLMAAQVPVIGWFVARWLPAAPRQAMAVLAVQLVAGIAAAAPVFLLERFAAT